MRALRLIRLGFFLAVVLPLLTAADRPNPAKPDDPTLRELKTRYYNIHTDLDQTLATDLSARMDVMYEQYVKTFADFKPPATNALLAVYLFETHQKYMAFTDYAGVNTGGLFVNGRHPYLTAYEQGQGRDALRRTLQHEAFHQFAHAAIAPQLPPWMNEGLAQYFEESIWANKDFIPDQIPPRRLRQLRQDIAQNKLLEFDQFLFITGKDWSSTLHTNLTKAAVWYNQAWAMAFFCSSAGDAEYHAKFMKLMQALHKDDTQPDFATRQCFSDLKDFRKKFNAWAAKVQPTPEATQQEHMDTLGDFLLAATQHNHPAPANMADFRNLVVDNNLKIQYTRGTVTYSSADRPAIYFSDAAGKIYSPDDLYFKDDPDAPLPEIVCRSGKRVYVTHFYMSAGKPEHEQLLEDAGE